MTNTSSIILSIIPLIPYIFKDRQDTKPSSTLHVVAIEPQQRLGNEVQAGKCDILVSHVQKTFIYKIRIPLT